MKTVDYYFAPHSPFSYLGHQRLLTLAARHGARVEPKPIDLAAVFAATGGQPVAQRPPQRQAYRMQELRRWSRLFGLPMHVQPKFFPVDPTAASLLLVATLQEEGAEQALELAGAIMRAVWEDEQDIADMSVLHELADACGIDGASLLVAAAAAPARQQYKAFTQEALDAGVFGAPWYIVDGHGFWGQDRLDFVERQLQTG